MSKTFQIINKRRLIILISSIMIIYGSLYIKNKLSVMSVEGWSEKVFPYHNSDVNDSIVKQNFLDKNNNSTEERYNELFKYFAHGYVEYQSLQGAQVLYPGEISSRGRNINGLEGFARFFPLVSSWLFSDHSEMLYLNKEYYNLIEVLKKGVLNGTDPENEEYWGNVEDKDQRIVEAADIALSLWLSKDKIWITLTVDEKQKIVKWLEQSINKEIVDNNWNLFPITIVKVLEALGYSNQENIIYVNDLYDNYKNKHYLGQGWFDDPPKGIDYYNAWSIHYSLFWLDQIDPDFDSHFIRKAHLEFIQFYKFLFSENGFPIMGRSVCYRLAAPAPIISAALINPEEISPGFAIRALDLTWTHFIENNALQDGKLTQGYYENDLRILDVYSGTGSCLWSLRSLIVAFYVDEFIPLWIAKEELLPIEKSDFEITNDRIGWTIIGDKSNQRITLEIKNNITNKFHLLIEHSTTDKIKEYFIKRPYRPNNEKALYKNYKYSTDAEVLLND